MIGGKAQPEGSTSLRVFEGDRLVFASSARWLHPLFELERHLEAARLETAQLRLEDKIIGRAAAFLIVRLGFRRAHAARMSRLGEEVLRTFGVRYSFDELVDRIDCATEALLENVSDVDEAYAIVKKRAAVSGVQGSPS